MTELTKLTLLAPSKKVYGDYQETLPNLHREILPFIEIDYISLTCLDSLSQNDLLSTLRILKSNLRLFDLDMVKTDVKQCKSLLQYENSLFPSLFSTEISSQQELKYKQKDFDVILDHYYKKSVSKKYVRIPGQFAHDVLCAQFSGKINLSGSLYTLTRIDFKLVVPGFN